MTGETLVNTSKGTAAAPNKNAVTVEQVCTVQLKPSVSALPGADCV